MAWQNWRNDTKRRRNESIFEIVARRSMSEVSPHLIVLFVTSVVLVIIAVIMFPKEGEAA